jgi:peptide methionine sulfoxide reductase MsrB
MNSIEQELFDSLDRVTSDSQLNRLRTEVRYLKIEGVIGEVFADDLIQQITERLKSTET